MEEYEDLVNVQKPKFAADISEARDMGDLLNNIPYDYALEQQGMVESRINEIDVLMKNAEVLKKANKDEVGLGSKVKVEVAGNSKIIQIVDQSEASVKDNKVSVESPVGEALFGKKIGDVVYVETPVSKIEFKIVEIT